MNALIDSLAYWLADYYLAATILFAAALVAMASFRQPAQRLAVAKAAIVGAALLAALCAVPGWSLVSLGGSEAKETARKAAVLGPHSVTQFEATTHAVELETIPPGTPALPPSVEVPVETQREIPWVSLIIIGYLLGSSAIVVWLVVGAIVAARLVQCAEDAPKTIWGSTRSSAGWERVQLSPEIDVPVALGVFRPRVLLPREWIEKRSSAELAAVLAHELAHIRNRDLIWLACCRGLLVALWAQPLYWLLRRWMRLDQELLADVAASDIADRREYARQLVNWAREAGSRPQVLVAMGLWERPSQLMLRVETLLDERRIVMRSWSPLGRIAALLSITITAVVLSLVTLQPNAISAESTEASPANDDGEGRLTYSGTVIDKRSEKPVAGATVTVRLQTSSTHPMKTLSESSRETTSDGRFEFRIPQELAADPRLYIELDVAHGDFAPVSGFGYALSMIRKNEKLGGSPFFDRIPLEPAATIQGTVRTPDGGVAADVSVLAFSAAEAFPLGDFGHSWSRGKTNASGEFRLNVVKQGKAILWLLPTDYAQQTHVLGERRGDLGTLALENGIRLSGRVVNREGQPIPGIWVNAELVDGPAKQPIDLPVVDAIRRSALTDADGTFELAPLPAGTYRVLPAEYPAENPRDDRQPRPLPDVFLPQRVELTAGQTPPPIEIAAVETVTIEAQIFDSAGQRRGGHEVDFYGRVGNEAGEYYFADGRPDAEGHIEFKVPKGLRDAKLSLSGNEHQALRYRWMAGGSLRSGREMDFGDLQRDHRGLEIIYFTAPILIVRAHDEQGKAIQEFKPAIFYEDSVKPRDADSHWLNGVSGEVGFERQADGRWRSEQLLPDEKFFVTVTADGYQPVTESLSLKEGETKEIEVTLPKAGGTATQPYAQPDEAESAKTSTKGETQHSVVGGATVTVFRAGDPAIPWDYEPNAVRLEVEDAERKPMPGVEATLYLVTQATGVREQAGERTSDERGVIEFRDVVSADIAADFRQKRQQGQFAGSLREMFYIVLRQPKFGTVVLPASDFAIASRGLKRRVRMRPAAELMGRVTDKGGKPVAGALVVAGALSGYFSLEGANAVKTDSEGRYRFTDLVAFDRAAGKSRIEEQMKWATAANPPQDKLYTAVYDPAEAMTDNRLVVTHPDFAVTSVGGDNIPGETNVVMAPAAAIEGRVMEFGSGKPAANVRVQASGRIVADESADLYQQVGSATPLFDMATHAASTRTDADGKYRLANLPAGTYEVWAQHPSNDWREIDWVSTGVQNQEPAPGRDVLQAPDLVIGPGGTIHGRLVDSDTGKRITLADKNARVRAMFHFLDGVNQRQAQMEDVPVAEDGSFTLRTFPVRTRVYVDVRKGLRLTGSDESDYRSPDDFYRTGQVFNLGQGESIDADVPVTSTQQLEEVRNTIQLGFERMRANFAEKAIRAFTAALAISPNESSALGGRAEAYERSRNFASAIGDFERLVELEPENFMWLNNLAHLLATSPVEADRDGPRAVELAKRAIEQAHGAGVPPATMSNLLDTFAAAQAETGDFKTAVATQRQAIEKAPQEMRAEMQQRLDAFEAGRAWRREVSSSSAE